MPPLTRREFIGAAGLGGVAACLSPGVAAGVQPGAVAPTRAKFPRGYLLVQELSTYNTSRFGAISTSAEAEGAFSALDDRLDALEFNSLFFDDRSLDGDLTAEFGGVTLTVDRMSAPYMQGATIDFVDTIEKQGFTIDNPNATGSCACGDSFH